MTKQTEIVFNLKPLEKLRKQLGDTYRARVGILGSKGFREAEDENGKKIPATIDNATLGLTHIFGSYTEHIPPRDFLFMPIRRFSKEILRALGAQSVKAALATGDIKRVYALLGAKAEEIVDNAFATGGFGEWPPNSPRTIAAKGSDKPLIDTQQLRKSITSDVVKKSDIVNTNIVHP